MEHLNGPSLKQQLEDRGPFDVPDVCRIASQVGSALDLAHSQGVVHGDLKPGNVMTHQYVAGETVHKVIDFGIGRLMTRRTGAPTILSSLGTTGKDEDDARTLVTLAYASPEQLSGEPVSERSDIYSFGVATYELLTGRRPFLASESTSLITKHLRQLPDPPTRFRPDIPSWAEAAVLKALAKDPRSRWDTASAFAQALSGTADSRTPVIAMSTSRLADGYEVGELVTRGRFGSHIYKGTHRATGHSVAIRVIRRGSDVDWKAARTRFMREARMTPVNHPSILRVRDYGEEKDLLYVVTDFIVGSSLRERLDRRGPYSWGEGRAIVTDLISATCALHTHGLLAFGLTPSIIRLSAEDERERLVISYAGVTEIHEVLRRTGAKRGRGRARIEDDAFYLAPELLVGEEADGRTDIFMIGVIAYEVLTGRRPFTATTLKGLLAAATSAKTVDPRTHARSLPAEAALCILRCLAGRPDQRFSDAIELESAWHATPR
jgi:serine/threonine protein kinase